MLKFSAQGINMKGRMHMNSQEMEARIKELEKKVQSLQDLEDIQRLQKTYGYYLEHWMYEEIIDLFADSPNTVLNLLAGVYLGKEGVRKYFSAFKDFSENPQLIHQIMQLSGIVDIAPDGKTARGRWYGFGLMAMPIGKGVRPSLIDGIYNTEYIKEEGAWKILQLNWNPLAVVSPIAGWIPKEQIEAAGNETIVSRNPESDHPREINSMYPSGYIVPFHYKHPVTRKKSGEEKHNTSLKRK
jgi:hypothetical protein